MSIYCISDVHGDYEKYHKMLQKIEFSDKDFLYVIGDVIDRKPHGVKILLDIMERENVQMILGNHEYMCLRVFDSIYGFEAHQLWLNNGGSCTHDDLKYKRSPEERERLLKFLRSLPTCMDIEINEQSYHLVHGFPADSPFHRVWSRPPHPHCVPFTDKITIVGHTPTANITEEWNRPLRIWHGRNIIDIDCGCGHDHELSRLACLRLDDMAEFYVGSDGL